MYFYFNLKEEMLKDEVAIDRGGHHKTVRGSGCRVSFQCIHVYVRWGGKEYLFFVMIMRWRFVLYVCVGFRFCCVFYVLKLNNKKIPVHL